MVTKHYTLMCERFVLILISPTRFICKFNFHAFVVVVFLNKRLPVRNRSDARVGLLGCLRKIVGMPEKDTWEA